MNKKNFILILFFIAPLVIYRLFFFMQGVPGRTFIIGIDGADPKIINELLIQKKIPHFQYLMENGSYGIHSAFDIDPNDITSPVIWTSVATGVRPEKHGISKKTLEKILIKKAAQGSPGKEPIEFFSGSQDREVPAIWNIFSQYGKKTAVVNWWITYPAEKINGFIVSDFLSEFHWVIFQKVLRGRTNNIEKIKRDDLPKATHPSSLFKQLTAYRQTPNYLGLDNEEELLTVRRIFDSAATNDLTHDLDFPAMSFSVPELVKYNYWFDRDSLMFTKYLLDRHKDLNLAMLYFSGIDAFSHVFWSFRTPGLFPGLNKDQVDRYGKIIDDYYILVDNYLGQIMKYLKKNDVLVICSDHGFQNRADYLGQLQAGNMRTGRHRPDGIFIIYGNNIKKNNNLKQISLLDILPTLLYLNRLPLSRGLEGKTLFGCIEESYLKKNRLNFIDSYRKRTKYENTAKEVRPHPFKEDIMARLKTLGYVN